MINTVNKIEIFFNMISPFLDCYIKSFYLASFTIDAIEFHVVFFLTLNLSLMIDTYQYEIA